jgi:hypothetical protein
LCGLLDGRLDGRYELALVLLGKRHVLLVVVRLIHASVIYLPLDKETETKIVYRYAAAMLLLRIVVIFGMVTEDCRDEELVRGLDMEKFCPLVTASRNRELIKHFNGCGNVESNEGQYTEKELVEASRDDLLLFVLDELEREPREVENDRHRYDSLLCPRHETNDNTQVEMKEDPHITHACVDAHDG